MRKLAIATRLWLSRKRRQSLCALVESATLKPSLSKRVTISECNLRALVTIIVAILINRALRK